MPKYSYIPRDLSWLSFNGRVLQEANDSTVPLKERIRFLGIFSNNLDEFFRVRVATLKRMIEFKGKGKKLDMHLEQHSQSILDEIQTIVLEQQNEFNRIWKNIVRDLKKENITLVDEKHLSKEQQVFVTKFFDEQVRGNVIPLMVESINEMPYLRDKSIYLGIVMRKKNSAYKSKYALIEVPVSAVGRFVELPTKTGGHQIILLEDIIRINLPVIFSYFGYDYFESAIFKITKDAEIDIDNDLSSNLIEKIEKGLKNRRKGKPVRFVYDREMDEGLLDYLIRRLNLNQKSNIIPGGRIHNFRHFMDFPDIVKQKSIRKASLTHPELSRSLRVTDVVLKKDVMLHFPYHSFNPVIDLLRESAMDPDVVSIKITAYRLAPASKVINALINAARNGKQVTVFLELKARFDEEANLEWKTIMEEEGINVLVGVPNKKVHAKLCIIQKKLGTRIVKYGFVSTGNLNEKTARVYADHCLLTASNTIMNEANSIFNYLENWQQGDRPIAKMRNLLISPINMRNSIIEFIHNEIAIAKKGKKAAITIKLNSITDISLIEHLYKAAKENVEVHLIIRGITTLKVNNDKMNSKLNAISIVDQYLEHARVMIFHNNGNEKVYISSADWMVRNLDHRIEVAVPINDKVIKKELIDIINIQLKDNQKARVLDASLMNKYVPLKGRKYKSQEETYLYLKGKK